MRTIHVAGVGRGLSVPGRGDVLIRTMVLILALVLFLLNIVIRADEAGPRQARAELLTLVGAPAVLLFFAFGLVVVDRTRISLHPEGIVREVYRRRVRKVSREITVLPWDEVGDMRLEAHPDPAVPNGGSMPVIRVVRRLSTSDEPEMVIMACEMKVEPNSLLAVLRWCRDNPCVRAQLGREDARELLRAPRVLARIGADRAASSASRTDEAR